MTKPALGALVGAVLGLLDGASAWAYPEARATIVTIVVSSTIKGVLTGAAAGWLGQRWKSTAGGIAAGIAIGFVLSTLAAIPVVLSNQSHYFDIVLPGMLLGAIVGFATQRYPRAVSGVPGRNAARMVLLILLSQAIASAQQAPPADPFEPLAVLVGQWEGTSEGRPGKGTVRREYMRVLNARFIRGKNRAEYPPHEKNPKGEVHEDEGWFSFDRARKRLVLRQFHVEGFVNHYLQDLTSTPEKIVFTTESIENIPPGWQARETHIVHGRDEIEEVFELAAPGKPFEVYSRTRLKRVT